MTSKPGISRWINTRVVIDMTTGAVLEREGYFYRGPIAAAEGGDPAAKLAAALKDIETANKSRDEAIASQAQLRKEMTELKGQVLTKEERDLFDKLKGEAAKIDEEKKKAAGQFDQLREDLVKKHTEELGKRDETIKTLTQRFKDTVVEAAFAGASDLFGGDTAKTVLDGVMGKAVLGGYVHVEDLEGGGFRIVVKNPAGQVIVGKDGKPAAFAEAIGELINVLPNKDRILRGSGKRGSGSSGGGGEGGSGEPDLVELTKRANAGDKDAIAALKKHQSTVGGIQMGRMG